MVDFSPLSRGIQAGAEGYARGIRAKQAEETRSLWHLEAQRNRDAERAKDEATYQQRLQAENLRKRREAERGAIVEQWKDVRKYVNENGKDLADYSKYISLINNTIIDVNKADDTVNLEDLSIGKLFPEYADIIQKDALSDEAKARAEYLRREGVLHPPKEKPNMYVVAYSNGSTESLTESERKTRLSEVEKNIRLESDNRKKENLREEAKALNNAKRVKDTSPENIADVSKTLSGKTKTDQMVSRMLNFDDELFKAKNDIYDRFKKLSPDDQGRVRDYYGYGDTVEAAIEKAEKSAPEDKDVKKTGAIDYEKEYKGFSKDEQDDVDYLAKQDGWTREEAIKFTMSEKGK